MKAPDFDALWQRLDDATCVTELLDLNADYLATKGAVVARLSEIDHRIKALEAERGALMGADPRANMTEFVCQRIGKIILEGQDCG